MIGTTLAVLATVAMHLWLADSGSIHWVGTLAVASVSASWGWLRGWLYGIRWRKMNERAGQVD
jgi:phosphotransferase system  glucose/maltose/N-acetylglucosamine-specific IIC component